MSTILVSAFPASIWDGSTPVRSGMGIEAAPNWQDWDRLVTELIKTQTVLADLTGGDTALTAAEIVNTPAGAIASINVQTALDELDTEKAALVHNHTYVSIVSAFANSAGGLTRRMATAQGTATAAATFNIAVQVPAGARILGVQLRVDVALTAGTGVSWAAAYNTGATQAIATGKSFNINTKVNASFDHFTETDITTGATDITITCNAVNFIAGGKITAVVYYEDLTTLGDYI
jgi:hypothetical protein